MDESVRKMVEDLGTFHGCLKDFTKLCPKLKDLFDGHDEEEKEKKTINEVSAMITNLANTVEDLKTAVKKIKPKPVSSSRFATERVIGRFLGDSL
jgi:uncharacterized coiled-coil DUF342 family protein